MRRACWLAVAVAVWRIMATTEVELHWGFDVGPLPKVIGWSYAALVLSLFAGWERLWSHTVGMVLASLFFGARLGGFFALMSNGRPDLEGAVWERLILILVLFLMHLAGQNRVATGKKTSCPTG